VSNSKGIEGLEGVLDTHGIDGAKAMLTPGHFARWASSLGDGKPQWLWSPHLRYLNERLVEIADRRFKGLVVTMPPRHGKSELIDRYLPAWWLGTFPQQRIILTSYEAEFAASWGGKARDIFERSCHLWGHEVNMRSSAAARWDLKQMDGGMITAGAGGPITGKGAHLLIIDDPVKNAEEANSKVMRDKLYDWWRSTAYSRLEPGGVVIIIQTRWHEDDLAGRVLRDHADDPDWHAVDFKAVCEGEEALGRVVGDPLWPERYPIERLDEIRKELGPYWWSSLYQQSPQPEGGGLFKRDWFKYCRISGSEINIEGKSYDADKLVNFTVADLATSTKETADFTVVATFCILPDGLGLVLRHLDRERVEGPDIPVILLKHQKRYRSCWVGIESGGFQLSIVQQARRSGVRVKELRPDKDKVARAIAITPLMEQGSVYFNDKAEYLATLEHELLHFPTSTHDDQVDVFGYAATMYGELNRFSVTQLIGGGHDEWRREKRLKEAVSGRDGRTKGGWRSSFEEFKKQLW